MRSLSRFSVMALTAARFTAAAAIVAACSGVEVTDPSEQVPPETTTRVVSVSPHLDTLPEGGQLHVQAVVTVNGTVDPAPSIAWRTTNPAIATVTTTGVVSAVEQGLVYVVATVGTVSDRVELLVIAPDVPVASVVVAPNSASVLVGSTVALAASPRDASGLELSGRTVTWSSNASGVATVSSSGVVLGVAQGTATISATSEGRTGTATITVSAPSPASVATVQVSPASATVAIGSTWQLSATTRAADGTVLTGRVVTWTSSNPGAATVSSTGIVSGVNAGTATITATSEGRTGTSVITVPATPPPPPPPPGTLAFTNVPAGTTLATSADWTNWPSGWVNERASTTGIARLATDATAPMSPSGVLEEFYPTGMTGGTAPGNVIFTGTNGATEVFVGFWFKMSENFQGHSSGVNKLVNLWTPYDMQWLRVNTYREYDTDGSRLNGPFYLVLTNSSSQFDLLQNQVQTMVPIVRGRWHKVEWHLTTAGAAPGNGRVRWWVDGVLVGDYSNLASTIGSAFSEFQISPTWGGNGDTMGSDNYMRFDQVVIYRR